MLLRLPPTLHYPITVTLLLKQPGETVERDEALFWYAYQTTVTEGDGLGNRVDVKKTFPTKFESTVDGEIVGWKIAKGDVVQGPINVVEIEEPCAHEIQFGGMCAECGKDMTASTYNTDVMDSMRAPIQMSHDNATLTVSQREATRIEEDAKRRLLASRRLSLVVDLDQTIIHATVDPTVGEWKEDVENPNHPAVKDVRAFQLTDDGPGMRGCWYYIKLRPGLEDFLQKISKLYELHIYTMGTRAYAQHIANIVDPERKLFGDRILSRDESGSLTAKNLQRLFPVDTKMVVIIDDRGDVWKWSPNLIKVSPYDFFVGIGDINSSFLPKKPELTPGPSGQNNHPKADSENSQPGTTGSLEQAQTNGSHASNGDGPNAEVSTLEQLVTMGGGDNPSLLQEQVNMQDEAILHQVEDRPLLQKQKELDAEDGLLDSQSSSDREPSASSEDDTQDSILSRPRHHLLEDHDTELFQLQERLEIVHQRFFEEYDRRRSQTLGGRVAALRGERLPFRDKDVDLKLVPDIKVVMPQIKQKVLEGVVLVFSGVLPLGTDTQNTDISLWAKSFGVAITTKIGSKTTHLVAGRNRTVKVREAARRPRIKIVTTQWLLDCLIHWKRLDEEPYLVPVHPEDRGDPVLGSSPASRDAIEASWLSSSEDDTGVSLTEDEGENDEAYASSGDGDADADMFEDADQEIMKSSGMTDVSLIGYDAAEEAAVHDELKEFLGSDDDESESDTELSSFLSVDSTTAAAVKKRKREDNEEEDDNPESTRLRDDELAGSRLAQRIKLSRGRTSSLKEVETLQDEAGAESNSKRPVPLPGSGAEEGWEKEDEDGTGFLDNPDDDEDELEREMLAAFEDGGYEETGEDEETADNR